MCIDGNDLTHIARSFILSKVTNLTIYCSEGEIWRRRSS